MIMIINIINKIIIIIIINININNIDKKYL